jgi:hypothetical protein
MTALRTGNRRGPRALTLIIAAAALATGCGTASKPAASARSGYQRALKYSDCMRTHGVPSFPDPTATAGGGSTLVIHGGPGSQLDPSAPSFSTAQQACAKLAPGGGSGPAGAIPPKAKEQALKFSACMRSHGVPNFPDPVFSGGGARLQLTGAGANPSSPAFKAAQKVCGSPLPGGIVRGSTSVGGPG